MSGGAILTGVCSHCKSFCKPHAIMVACKGIWTQNFWKAVSGEFLATMIFVMISLGSTINWGRNDSTPPPLIALCFGLSIATMVQCFGHISGGHINPAVTAAMVCTRKLSLAKSVFYIVAQCLGSLVGAGLLYSVTPPDVLGDMGVTMINSQLSPGHGLLIEMLITFQLVFTIFASCDEKRHDRSGSAALAIGFSVTIGHLFAIPYTSASMNPARSFGPAVIIGKWKDHWVYWVGPLMGGIIAAALYEFLYCPDPDIKRRLQEVLSKASQPSSRKYTEVDDNRSHLEADDLVMRPGTVHSFDMDRGDSRKDRDPANDSLPCV
ncbi:aquaporin-4 [Protopterus annectens]|uniref:aquaporin-4 n=1 Tax=Protopterus annectens TaxID=7888 RepID=UPI001CFA1CE1|nr:aquaporin-4 [Protopterus annectens]